MGAEAADGAESTVAAETETRMGTFRTRGAVQVFERFAIVQLFYLLKMIRAGVLKNPHPKLAKSASFRMGHPQDQFRHQVLGLRS
jgi:hypothetical protein